MFLSSFLHFWDWFSVEKTSQPSTKQDSHLTTSVTIVEGINLSWWPLKKIPHRILIILDSVMLIYWNHSSQEDCVLQLASLASVALSRKRALWKRIPKHKWFLRKKYLWTLGRLEIILKPPVVTEHEKVFTYQGTHLPGLGYFQGSSSDSVNCLDLETLAEGAEGVLIKRFHRQVLFFFWQSKACFEFIRKRNFFFF